MCLLVNNIIADLKKAKKPITVYKILRKPYYPYIDDTLYYTPYWNISCKIGDTLEGSHIGTKIFFRSVCCTNEVSSEGVHAYKSLFAARHSGIPSNYGGYFYITERKIPKGAEYWEGVENSCTEIAATQMKFVKVIEKYEFPKDYILGPAIGATTLSKIATHYITDEGEIKPIKEGQKVDMWHLAWVIDDIKKLVPETITRDDKTYKLCIKANKSWAGPFEATFSNAVTHCAISYETEDCSSQLFKFISHATDEGYVYAWILIKLITCGIIGESDLEEKVRFTLIP